MERRLQVLEKQGQKSVKLLRLCLLAEAVMFMVLIVWTADLKTTSETGIAATSKRVYILEEIAEKDINEKAIQRQEIAAMESKMNALQQDFDQLQDGIRLNEIAKVEKEALSKTQVMVLQQDFNQFKENEQVLQREFETEMKRQLEQKRDETSTATAALRQEFIDLLRDKQVLEREFEQIKQQVKQTQDEASMAAAALRQEFIELLSDKQSKVAFQLETALMKQEMDRLKQNEEALKRDIENKSARNCSLQEFKDLLQQEFGQYKESEQVLEREFEKTKQQLKQTQEEAFTAAAALRQEFIDLLSDKQSKTAFRLESTLIKQEMNRLKQNEEALKQQVENKLANITPTAEVIELRGQQEQIQQELDECKHYEQVFNNELKALKQQLKLKQNEASSASKSAALQKELIDMFLHGQNEMASKLDGMLAKQELLDNIATELWDKQALVWTAQHEVEQLLNRELEKMNQSHKLEAETRELEIAELRHQIQALRKEATDSQAKLANHCSQTSTATDVSEEKVEELIKLAQQGPSAGSVWRLLVILWMMFYLFIYHEKFRNEMRGKINKLIEKRKTDREYYAQRVQVDELKEKQKSDRKQLVQVIYVLVQVIYKLSQFAKKLKAEIATLKNRQEQIDILNDHYIPALLPFHITVPLYILYNKPFYSCSKPFYTRPQGYKMCLAVHASSTEEGKSVSVIIFLMQGLFDDELVWPFRGKITIYLLNQFQDRRHQEITIKSQLNGERVTEGKRAAIGIGNLSYIPDMDTQYLKHNRLRFQIANVELKDAVVVVVPTEVMMTNFEGYRQNSEQWYSEPFYTHAGGYKMCLSVHANGVEDATGTHVSVFVHLMQRERNDQLKWPFHAEITIQLLNQLGDEGHWTETIDFDDGSLRARRVLRQGRCFPLSIHGEGKAKFIAHTQLGTKDREYLKNDCLRFRISKVVIKST